MKIRNNENYQHILENIVKEGCEVNDTYELVCEKYSFMGTTTGIKDIFSIDDAFEYNFLHAISTFNDVTIGPYVMNKYFLLIPELRKAMHCLINDCKESRRCVMKFPEEHCFQSIQFLVRENTVNVGCYMRSCNAIENFGYDMWICSILADMFKKFYNDLFGEELYEFHKIEMVVGSMHLFVKDKGKINVC